jgi:dipeptidyl aminopeptidase/acylaminoacyl peptidase
MLTVSRSRSRLYLGLVVVLALFPTSLAAQERAVTIENLLSAPFPSSLTAAPSGGMTAWVQNDRGVRNLWVAGPPEWQGRQLTRYTEDDGQEIGDIAFSPDGKTIVYVRGAGANRQGENPNPASNPAGVEQALWQIGIDGGEPARIGQGNSPAISPRGDGVAFARAGQIWWVPLNGAAEPKQLVKARGTSGSLRWSPDGSRLAFVSGRGDHSFIGIYNVADTTLHWVQPSVDLDGSPAWSPDGQRLAFIRTPTSSALTIFRPTREAMPWAIMIAQAATGEAKEAWRADEGRGSAFWGVVADNQLFWGAGDRIVFPWEKTGWVQLYAVPANGGAATLLTPGDFEAEHVALSPDRRHVYYSSNQGDIDRRHLWRVAVAGGRPEALTGGEGVEWAPTPSSTGAVAFLRSDARTPAHAAVWTDGSARALVPGALTHYPSQALVVPQAVTITAADGMQVPAQLFLPRGAKAGDRRPALIFIHGGSRRQMFLGFHHGSYYHNAYALNQYLANQGYVVLSLNYRSGIGYGMEFREAPNYGASGGSEFYDVLGAGLYLRGRAEVDPARIGLWGGSYGGYLTAMGLSRASDLFAAGVDIHGVHDWNVGIRTFIPSYNTLERPEEANIAFMASPMATIDGWRSPVLVIHGDDDRNVSFVETVTLVEALRRRGVEVEQLVFPDEVHSFLRHANWLAAYRATADFFERKLKGKN